MAVELTAFNPPSSRFSRFGWESIVPGVGLLTLEFTDGSTWWYADVPAAIFESFLLAASRGAYFDAHIKPFYLATKKIVDESNSHR